MSGRGNPPLGAPSPPLTVLAVQPFVDLKTGTLVPWALQFLVRLSGSITGSGGIIDNITQIINQGATSVSITEIQGAADGLMAAMAPAEWNTEARLLVLERLIFALTTVAAADIRTRLAAVEAIAAEALAASFRASMGAPAGPSLAVQIGGVAQSTTTLNFGSGLGGTTSGGVTTITTTGGSRPAGSAFAWVNQGTAAYTDIAGGPLVIRDGDNLTLGNNWRLLIKPVPGTDFTLTAQLGSQGLTSGAFQPDFGLVAYNSGTGSFVAFYQAQQQAFPAFFCGINQWNSATSYNSAILSNVVRPTNPVWFRVAFTLSSGTLIYYTSIDGVDWDEVGVTSVSAFISALTHVGFGFDAAYLPVANQSESAKLYNWTGV